MPFRVLSLENCFTLLKIGEPKAGWQGGSAEGFALFIFLNKFLFQYCLMTVYNLFSCIQFHGVHFAL